MISAFEWQTVKEKPIGRQPDSLEPDAMQYVPSTNIDPPVISKPIQMREEKIIISGLENLKEVGNTAKDETEPSINSEEPQGFFAQYKLDPPAENDSIFIRVERSPEPISGFSNFYKQLSTMMKYPAPARRMGTEGKVFVEFVVNKNGEPVDFKVIRGIGYGCDEEAIRVLALTQWEPGKQRGKPVHVRMILPIIFKLNN